MKLYYSIILFLLLIFPTLVPAFDTGAYIPAYRLNFLPGALSTLRRPSYDPAPGVWDGLIFADYKIPPEKKLPEYWYERSWSLRLGRGFNSYYLHIPLDEDFLSAYTPDPGHISYLQSIISESEPRIYLSLLGSSKDFMPVVSDKEEFENLVLRLTEISRDYKLDGIDIDWEFPAAPKDYEILSIKILVEALKKQLPEGTVLSLALSRWRLPDQELFDMVDEIHLMAYDGYGRHSTFESAEADTEIILKRFNQSSDKLVLGLPYYGRIYSPESEDYWTGTMNYAEITRNYSPGYNDDEAGGYFFNGPSTIKSKTEWAINRGLGGVFVWEPFYDSDGSDSLTTAIYRAMENR